MSTKPARLTKTYPHLFKEVLWSGGLLSVQFMIDEEPPEEQISNVNAVPTTSDGKFVVIQLADGNWEIPGGTIEADETPLDALRRELIEEAGAHLQSVAYIGAWRMVSHADKPFRPHLPHPIAYRAVYRCEVKLIGPPQIPTDGGEKVAAVRPMNLSEAVQRFEEIDRHDIAELYRLAADFKHVKDNL